MRGSDLEKEEMKLELVDLSTKEKRGGGDRFEVILESPWAALNIIPLNAK